MKVLVTGGTGFIGSHLVKVLLEDGRNVVIASDFAHMGLENLVKLGISSSDIELRRADLTHYGQALEAVRDAEIVFHLAARVGSVEYLHGSELAEVTALQTNLLIDTNVFKACIESGVREIIYASSCAVYPMHKQSSRGAIFAESSLDLKTLDFSQPRTSALEPTLRIDPDGGYGWAKLLGEIQLSWVKSIKTGIARIFNVYGENEPPRERAHVIADLARKAILYPQVEFVVWGDGTQTRDFLYVSDCVDALLKLEKALSVAANSTNSIIVNVGSDEAVPISTIAEKIVKISGKDIPIIYDPTKPVGPLSRTADTTRAKTLLGWQPRIGLDEGLKRTYSWIENGLKARNVS